MNSSTENECRICGKSIEKNVINTNNILDGTNFIFFYCDDCDALSSQSYDRSQLYNRTKNNTNFTPKSQFFFNKLKFIFLKNWLKHILAPISQHAKVLDFGCGNADIANICDMLGYSTHAYDVQTDRPSNLHTNISYWHPADFDQNETLYDVIFLRHVLEHVPDPLLVLSQLVPKLAEDGIIIIEVPNYHSAHRKLMGKRWTGYFSPYHEMVFSKLAFEKICSKLGLGHQITEKEPFIFGVFLMQLGLDRTTARLMSLLLYPLQYMISKSFGTSEAIQCIIKKN